MSLSSSELARFREQLGDWYLHHARDLPWRRTGDPYRIWISEIMLQQTTVTAVVPYFDRFITRFPTVIQLAAAPQDEVLRYWEGLGYYSRARNIHKTSQIIVAQHGCVFPRTVDELLELPGIGRYTAGAIVSFAFDLRAPIVEANTLRLYARLMGLTENPRSSSGQKKLWEFADQIVSDKNPGAFNQALMELGALVCTPNDPKCAECPVQFACSAARSGSQAEIPVPNVRPEITSVVAFSIAIGCGGKYLLRKNPDGERWAGLWDFVRFEDEVAASLMSKAELKAEIGVPRKLGMRLKDAVRDRVQVDASDMRFMTQITHSVTRYRIRLQCLVAATSSTCAETDDLRWVAPDQFESFPLSVTGRKLAKLIEGMPL